MNAHYQVLKQTCLEFKRIEHQEVTFCFLTYRFNLSRQIDDARAAGFRVHIIKQSTGEKMLNGKMHFLTSTKIFDNYFCHSIKEIMQNVRSIFWYVRWIRHIHPELILISSNTFSRDTSLFIRATRIMKIPVYNIPFGYKTPQSLLDYRHPVKCFSSRLIRFLFPRYCIKMGHHQYLPLSPASVLGLELTGCGAKRPWTMNANDIDVVFADSPFSLDLFNDQNLPQRQIVKVGRYPEVNFKAVMRKFFSEHPRIKASLPYVLINIPTPLSAVLEKDYCMIKKPVKIIESFICLPEDIKQKVNIVWTVHPRLRAENYLFFKDHDVNITERPAEDLIPSCYMFIGCNSTLFTSALHYKKPVINYQIFGRDEVLFNGIKGCIQVKDRKQYTDLVLKLITDKDYYHKRQTGIQFEHFGYRAKDSMTAAEYIEFIM